MKKIVLFLAILFSFAIYEVQAEDWTDLQHEVSFSYGGFPVFDMLDYYENHFNPVEGSVDFYDDKGKFGSFNISYLFFPDENWGIGLVYSYNNSDKRILNNLLPVGDFNNSFHTIAPSFKYNWYNYDFITLYSRVNLGVTIATSKASFFNETEHQTEEKTKVTPFFMYQVSPIGIELGRQFAGFVEVGIGHMGVAMAGLRYRM
ncbi:hypothetical protein [Parabacteroides bouchesdurhonensis]|uniref:hypothetical protein n=1 Tax=Parabacteroides bouchesdurhonensis TaxID=1936995 RepID=UPI000C84C44F|nr:hypothetical protein [Parabacteroides bouchesdurhonensis]